MADIGSFSFVVTADPTQAISAIDTVATKTKGLFDKLSSFSLGGLGALVGFGALGTFLKSGVDDLARLALQAREFGFSISTMAAMERLAVGHTEELEKALRVLERGLGSIKTGSKEYADKLQGIGISSQQIASMPLEQAYRMVADRIAGLSDHSQKAIAAYELFGKTGQALLPVLEKGSAGLDQAAASVNRFGGVSDDAAAKALAFKRAMRELEQGLQDIKRAAAVGAIGITDRIAGEIEFWRRVLTSGEALDPGKIAQELGKMRRLEAEVQEGKDRGSVADQKALKVMEQFTEGIEREILALNEGAVAAELLKLKTEGVGDAQLAVAKQLLAQKTGAEFGKLMQPFTLDGGAAKVTADNLKQVEMRLKGFSDAQIDAFMKAERAAEGMKRRWEQLQQVIEETMTPIEKANEELFVLEAMFARGAFDQNLDALIRKLAGLEAQITGFGGNVPSNPAIEYGTREYSRAVFESTMRQQGPAQELLRATQQNGQELKAFLKKMDELIAAVKDQQKKVAILR
jgi:hypothetical protein